jgi:hypothetical protein
VVNRHPAQTSAAASPAPGHNTARVIPGDRRALFKRVDEPVENPVDKLWKTG